MKKVTYKDHDGNPVSIINKASNVLMDNGETLEKAISKADMFTPNITQESSISKVGQGVDVDYHESVKDGVYEECVFEGRTLVNIASRVGEFSIVSTVSNHGQKEIATNTLLKRNTKYLLALDYNVTFDDASTSKSFYFDAGHGYSYIGTQSNRVISSSNGSGHFVTTFTTKDEEKTINSNIHLTVFKGGDSKAIINNLVIIEYQDGMENWDIPYFTGICDSKMPILHNVGKNLFNGELELGGFNHSTGIPAVSSITKRNVDYITIKPNTQLSFSVNDGESGINWFFYDINKKHISNTFAKTVTTPSTAHYLRFYNLVGNIPLSDYRIMITETPTPSTYEDYKTNILQTSEEIVLRSLPNGTKDTYNALTGEYVRRIGEVVLNGSESWTIREDLKTEQTNCFYISVKDKKKLGLVLSDKLSTLTNPDKIVDNTIEDFRWTGGYFFIHKNISTVVDFKLWLQSNPITVQYELATPITTTIKPSTTPFSYANGHVILESGSTEQSLLPTLKYSVITSRTGQVVQTTKILHQQEKQIASLEDKLSAAIVNLKYNNIIEQYKIGFAEDSLNKEEVI